MKKSYILIIALLLVCTQAWSQVLETKSLSMERGYEPVLMYYVGRYLEIDSLAVSTDQLFLYAYYSETSSWEPVPFQIDEENPYNSSNGVLDSTDALIFLAKDIGDKVSLGNWVDDQEAQFNKRYEIEIADSRDKSKLGWCYLYQSSTLTRSDKTYLSYDPENDKVVGEFYTLDYGQKWFPENITITSEGGGNNVDFYDRTKLRFSVELYGFPTLLFEDDLALQVEDSIRYTANSVVHFKRNIPMELMLGGFPSGRSVSFTMNYFPYSTIFNGEIGLDFDVENAKVKMVRMSYDLNSNAVGMMFSSGDSNGVRNPIPSEADIIVDGTGKSDGVDTTIVKNAPNWTMVTDEQGGIGTMLTLNNVRYESEPQIVEPAPYSQRLYYWDDLTGSTLIPYDGDWDSGDSLSYGDHGMLFTSDALTDSFHYVSTTYLIPAGQTTEIAQDIFMNNNSSLNMRTRLQDFVVDINSKENNQIAATYKLKPNYPNPFNSATIIPFELTKSGMVSLKIFDIRGNHILTLVDEKLNAGMYSYIWNGNHKDNNLVSSGVYFYTIQTDDFKASRKMIFLK